MTPIAVDTLLTQIAAAIYNQRLGYLAVNGTTDWRRHRHGAGTGELVTGSPPTARLRLRASKHAAHAIEIGFSHACYDPARPTDATVHGQILLHPAGGSNLTSAPSTSTTPTTTSWPMRLHPSMTIGCTGRATSTP